MYFKRELENRETNFNTRFSTAGMRTAVNDNKNNDNSGVLRVIQNSSMEEASKPMPNLARKKTQRTARKTTSNTKRKTTKSKRSSGTLPKLAK